MSADFTPIIPDPPAQPSKGSYMDLNPFRFWCQKVLPLVYDESLSYYEVLCKLVDYLNKTMEDVGVLHDDVDSMFASFQALTNWTDQQIEAVVTAYGELQSYVNNYFDNLDVQQEINNKLDAMAAAGTLTTLLSPFLPDAVASWLAAHVDPATGYVVDDTLSIAGAAADAKTTGDALKEIYHDYLENIIYHVSDNKANPALFESGILYANGTIVASDSAIHTGLIPVKPGMNIRALIGLNSEYYENIFMNHIAAYDSSKTLVAASGTDETVSIFRVPSGIYYLNITVPTSYITNPFMLMVYDSAEAIESFSIYYTPYWSYKEDFLTDDSKEAIYAVTNNFLNAVTYHEPVNLADPNDFTLGAYMLADGTVVEQESAFYTGFIKVNTGEIIRALFAYNKIYQGSVYIRRVTAFDDDKNVIPELGSDVNSPTYNVPAGIKYIRISSALSYVTDRYNMMIYDATDGTLSEYSDYFAPYFTYSRDFLTEETKAIIDNLEFSKSASSLSDSSASLGDGDSITITAPKTPKNALYTFDADITSFNTLYFGRNRTSSYGGFIEIDDTNITVYQHISAGNDTQMYTAAHGLTIEDHITAYLKISAKGVGKLTLSTASGIYTSESFQFGGANGTVKAESSGSVFTNASLRFFSPKWNSDYFFFWDSYEDFVAKYMVDEGADNVCFDAYPGRGSSDAKTFFDLLMEIREPKCVIWGLGMNDADGESSVNVTWNTARQAVENYCELHDIELIYVTVPNTPTRINSFKNAIMQASGKRVVDVAAAVGAAETGSEWYAGLLSSDNVHPTTLGSKVIANVICAGIPELVN